MIDAFHATLAEMVHAERPVQTKGHPLVPVAMRHVGKDSIRHVIHCFLQGQGAVAGSRSASSKN